MEVILSGGYSERLGTFVTYCGKSEAINDAFRNNFLDHNLIECYFSDSIAKVFKIFLEINILIFVPSVRNAKSLRK